MLPKIVNERKLPFFRGRIHVLNALSLPVLAVSVVKNHDEKQIIVAYFIFFACCLFNVFASSILHLKKWDTSRDSLFKRLDYAGIFLVIGSSAFPAFLYYMKNDSTMLFISLTHWLVIFGGVFGSLIFNFINTSKSFRSIIYPFFGAPYVYLEYKFIENGQYHSAVMGFLTAFFYITGSVFYAKDSPNLFPGIFESHELFHVFCWLAFLASFFLNFQLTKLSP